MSKLKFQKNKKGVELTLNTIIIFVIMIIVLVVVISFFITHYGSNSDSLSSIGSNAIAGAKNFTK